jgi:hypothetical protein
MRTPIGRQDKPAGELRIRVMRSPVICIEACEVSAARGRIELRELQLVLPLCIHVALHQRGILLCVRIRAQISNERPSGQGSANRQSQGRSLHFLATQFMAYGWHRFGTAMAHAGYGASRQEDASPTEAVSRTNEWSIGCRAALRVCADARLSGIQDS